MILHQIQVETSVYLKAFSTLNFNAGQILQNKTHFKTYNITFKLNFFTSMMLSTLIPKDPSS